MTTSPKALIFDFKRFAVHDGKGIRTTVFFKGCPLRCRWCHNPEGLLPIPHTIYLANKCMHCRCCTKDPHVSYMDRPVFKGEDDLTLARTLCPTEALTLDSHYYTIDEIVEKVKEDEVFFKQGGGVTFSGGEPFMQFEALYALAKKCHEAGIHTAIETSLYTKPDNLKKILPYLDQIYCDLKLYDKEAHKKYTGVENTRIKDNIRFLLTATNKQITVRTPLIPHITAEKENISAIASFLKDCNKEAHYEMLNYNPLAGAKYDLTPFAFTLKDAQPLNKEELAALKEVALKAGLIHVK
jgi:pyruvate formate lyase activating enzyme